MAMFDSVQVYVSEFVMINITMNVPEEQGVITAEEFIAKSYQFGTLLKWDTVPDIDWSKREAVIFVCSYRDTIFAIDKHGSRVVLGCGNTMIKVMRANPNVNLVIDG